MSVLEAKSFVLFYDSSLKSVERELAAFQDEHNIRFKTVRVEFSKGKVDLKFNPKTTYLALFNASSNESLNYEIFFKCFNYSRNRHSMAFIRDFDPNFRQNLAGIIYSALPMAKFILKPTNELMYCLLTARDDIELDANVLLSPKSIETFYISECSRSEFDNAPAHPNFHRYHFPMARLQGDYYTISDQFSTFNHFLQRDPSASAPDVLKYKLPLKLKPDSSLLDNPAYPACIDLSRFINEIASLPEVTESVHNTFLEVIDEILGWSRSHDPLPFPGTSGLKSTMEMYLRLFEDFEDRVKTISPNLPAARTFEIALKKMVPCTRSIKRQLLRLSDDEPTWLTAAKSFSDAESRNLLHSMSKRQKPATELPEGSVSMPLLVPYLNVEWPEYSESEVSSPYQTALKRLESQQLEIKRFAQ